MRRTSIRVLILLLGAGLSLFLTACGAKIQGTYRGVVVNDSYGVSADLFLTLSDNEGLVSGNMTVGAPLTGGGFVSGRREGTNFQFTTSDGAGGRIVWIGQVDGRNIGGHYVVEPGMLTTLVAGADKQQGRWEARR